MVEKIKRTYADTEVWALAVNIECPHCGAHWVEIDKDECGNTYTLECEDGCGKKFEMYFDAD
jgi:transcription elongation factor Elf1